MTDLKILFLITSSKTHDHNGHFTIDRVDLTRRLDVINTWGQDVIHMGHDIMFFEGGSDVEYYDDDTKTLYLTEGDGYENTNNPSELFIKVQKAFDWVIKNKNFDIVYNCDDDVFVNLPEFLKLDFSYDFVSQGSMGGAGFIMSKKAMELIVNYRDYEYRNCDVAIFDIIRKEGVKNGLKINNHNIKSSPFYIPGELYATIHYVSGRRAYHLYNVFKYYQENGYTNRKILIGGPLESYERNPIVSYESSAKRKSPRWYDFTVDINNWEYHGGYIRSTLNFSRFIDYWPYGQKSTKVFVINFNVVLSDYIGTHSFIPNLNQLISKCEDSLIDKNNLFLMSQTDQKIDGWIIDNNIKTEFKLDFELLNNFNYYRKI